MFLKITITCVLSIFPCLVQCTRHTNWKWQTRSCWWGCRSVIQLTKKRTIATKLCQMINPLTFPTSRHSTCAHSLPIRLIESSLPSWDIHCSPQSCTTWLPQNKHINFCASAHTRLNWCDHIIGLVSAALLLVSHVNVVRSNWMLPHYFG